MEDTTKVEDSGSIYRRMAERRIKENESEENPYELSPLEWIEYISKDDDKD